MDADAVNVIKGRAPLRASGKVRAALAKRGHGVGTVSYVYSPKNDRSFVLASDLELCHFLHLEGDGDVKSYDLDSKRVVEYLAGHGYVASRPDAISQLFSGRQRITEVKYQRDLDGDLRTELQVAVQQKAARAIGADWVAYTDTIALDEEEYLHDWLQIVVTISQVASELTAALEGNVDTAIKKRGSLTLGELYALDLDEWPLVFSMAFRLQQTGRLAVDLRMQPLSWETVFSNSGRGSTS